MPISKNKKLVLESNKEEVEAIIKASVNGYPLANRELKKSFKILSISSSMKGTLALTTSRPS